VAEVTIFRATLADAEELYANLRPADRAECEAYGKPSVEDGIQDSVKDSTGFCWTARREGELMAVFGVAPIAFTGQWGGFGSPWMLGTPLLDRHPRILQRLAPRVRADHAEGLPAPDELRPREKHPQCALAETPRVPPPRP